jgi:hypothetical protein
MNVQEKLGVERSTPAGEWTRVLVTHENLAWNEVVMGRLDPFAVFSREVTPPAKRSIHS